eukprot:6191587-Prymnesium_polylepis.2
MGVSHWPLHYIITQQRAQTRKYHRYNCVGIGGPPRLTPMAIPPLACGFASRSALGPPKSISLRLRSGCSCERGTPIGGSDDTCWICARGGGRRAG